LKPHCVKGMQTCLCNAEPALKVNSHILCRATAVVAAGNGATAEDRMKVYTSPDQLPLIGPVVATHVTGKHYAAQAHGFRARHATSHRILTAPTHILMALHALMHAGIFNATRCCTIKPHQYSLAYPRSFTRAHMPLAHHVDHLRTVFRLQGRAGAWKRPALSSLASSCSSASLLQ
jgi:hypothetical protein